MVGHSMMATFKDTLKEMRKSGKAVHLSSVELLSLKKRGTSSLKMMSMVRGKEVTWTISFPLSRQPLAS